MSKLQLGKDACQLPLYNHKKEVIAYAIIDCDKFDLVNSHVWTLRQRYAQTLITGPDGKPCHLHLSRYLLGLWCGDTEITQFRNGERLDCRLTNIRAVPAGDSLKKEPLFRGLVNADPHRRAKRKRGQQWWNVPLSFSRLHEPPSDVRVYKPGDADYPIS